MSDSRLEKFIYAICSMDVSDLPVPLSRIEKLWNCLITGETPDFEPLSRNEKYLMAMLDRYDISNLPAPMSRGEKLLYKIAVGETDLSDVPGYLSRYEELLKYLIENGEISEDDFEYVLYTLNQSLSTLYSTAEKPVKSAILKGQTLVNVIDCLNINNYTMKFDDMTVTDGYVTAPYVGGNQYMTITKDKMPLLKANTEYTVIVEIKDMSCGGMVVNHGFLGSQKNIFTDTTILTLKNIGIHAFKRTTKSELDDTFLSFCLHPTFNAVPGEITFRFMLLEGDYTNVDIPYFEGMQSVKMPVLTTSNEDGTKSNILTTPEDLELRGIGDVQDTLDCLTGELTQRIGEVVLDGSTISYYSETYMKELSTAVLTSKFSNCDIDNPIMCNDLSTYMRHENLWEKWTSEDSGVSTVSDIWGLCIRLPHTLTGVTTADSKDTVTQKFKAYLQQNPITVQYKLATESVKTVDLTVVDQNNQPTELGTFENLTHVSLEAENLIPEVEMEVATNLLEDTVFSLTDAFNTLYPTAEKPVKSAILKGNTLVNHKKDNVVISPELSNCYDYTLSGCKSNTNYLIKFNAEHDEDVMVGFLIDTSTWSTTEIKWAKPGNITVIINSGSTPNYLRIRAKSCENLMIIEYQEGMENMDIPYFEGMQSVKMPVLTTSNEDGTKSNILTTPEDLELRGIGDVQDTLDCLTGEYTKTIYEYTFTGNEPWIISGGNKGGYTYFNFSSNKLPIMFKYNSDRNVPISCDKLPTINYTDFDEGTKSVGINLSYFFRLNFSDCDSNNGATVEDLKAYLKANPTTVQYPISKSVKTVDLSVVDQDGNATTLETFDDTTHVLLESEGLIPTAALTVRTKIPSASSTSLLMDDISTEQQQLETTVDKQSNNVDATMVATTEIFEETL